MGSVPNVIGAAVWPAGVGRWWLVEELWRRCNGRTEGPDNVWKGNGLSGMLRSVWDARDRGRGRCGVSS